MLTLAVLLLVLLFVSGTHIAVALGLTASFILLVIEQVPIATLGQVAFKSMDSYALAAVPLFVLAGNLLTKGQIAQVIVDLIGSVVRTFRAGLALTAMLSCVFFAAISGSSVASAAAIGSATVETLKAEKYPASFAAGIVAVGGTLGLMIPPSLSFILIGSMVGLPIDKLFIAGVMPGIFEGIVLCIATIYISRKRGYGMPPRPAEWSKFRVKLLPASGALFLPVLIIGTIYGGIFTPTEVSAVAAAYAAALSLWVYRTMSLMDFWRSVKETIASSAMLYSIVLGGSLLAFAITRLGFATYLATTLNGLGLPSWAFLIIVAVLLLVLGMFLDGVSLIVLTAPILFQLINAYGINPIHFAVILTALVEIATITPPVGLNIFVMSGVAGIRVEEVVKGVWPFYLARLFSLLFIIFVPQLSLMLL